MSTERAIEYLPLDEIQPDPRNPRRHDLSLIGDSVDRFGVVDVITVDARTGRIVSGHGRHRTLTALRDKGAAPPDGVRVDADGRWLVPVSSGWASRDDSEAAAALIAMNRTTELAGWVDDELLALLEGLGDLAGVGYDERDLDALRLELEAVSDDVPDFSPDDSGLSELDKLAPKHCHQCGYDVANNPEGLAPWSA